MKTLIAFRITELFQNQNNNLVMNTFPNILVKYGSKSSPKINSKFVCKQDNQGYFVEFSCYYCYYCSVISLHSAIKAEKKAVQYRYIASLDHFEDRKMIANLL